MLVLTVGRTVLNDSMVGAFAIAASFMRMVFVSGTVYGVRFNIAVAVAIMCVGRVKFPPREGAFCMVEQIRCGLGVASSLSAMRGGKAFQLKPDAHSCADVFIADFIFPFVLAFGVIAVATVNSSLPQPAWLAACALLLSSVRRCLPPR